MSNITLGADIEFVGFRDNVPASVIGMIGGSKDSPLFVEGGNLQEDNVLAEMAIDPVNSEDEWVERINSVRNELIAKVAGLELRAIAACQFPDEELLAPMAQEFGCDPDINAWSLNVNDPPNAKAVGSLRTCGGHIHLGWDIDEEDIITRAAVAQWMDVFLGLPSVLKDLNRERRNVYGKAGAFRVKPYGIEYRTLSNFWTENEDDMRWAYRQAIKALETALEKGEVEDADPELIQKAINSGDIVTARAILNTLEIS